MLYLLEHYALLLAVRGAMAFLFGIAAVISSEPMLFGLVLLYSAFMLMDGIHTLFMGISLNPDYQGWWAAVVEGAGGILIGLLTLFWPNISGPVLVGLVAGWVLLSGTFQIAAGQELRRLVGGEWLMILCGGLALILAICLFAFSGQGGVSLLWITGIYAMISGFMRIIDASRLHFQLHRFETGSA